ncbi:MAG TPA: hypothetical protein VER32_12430 [Pyrinomonadaceae bacterium]|nr:hypothetical protein [Pyrinomonadaceae bacterium]
MTKSIPRLILCTALLLITFPDALSQKRKACPTPPPSPFKHSGEIVTSFDASRRLVRTTLEHPGPISAGAEGPVYLSASFVHRDARTGARQTLDLVFVSASRVNRFGRSHDITLVSDGRAVGLSSPARYESKSSGGTVYETAGVTLTAENLAALTGARKVSARLGAVEFELTKNHLEALREMASLMGNSPSRWSAE